MAAVRPFHKYRGESSFSLNKLVELSTEQISLLVPPQIKYRVTVNPTPRTIRFYTASGLVDKPLARAGGVALYGYRHLLQILAVKYLQTQYLPLPKIKSLVENADNRDLELLLPSLPLATSGLRGQALYNRFHSERPVVVPEQQIAHGHRPAGGSDTAETVGAVAYADNTWHRSEIWPGIELQIHSAVLSAEDRERLRGALLRELGTLRGWPEQRGKA